MKLRLKRVLLVLCMLACFFSLSACGQAETVEEPIDPMISMALEEGAKQYINAFEAMTEEDIEAGIAEAEKAKESVMVAALTSWKNSKADLGDFVSVDSIAVDRIDEGYTVTLQTTFTQRKMEFSVSATEDLAEVTEIVIAPEYTVGAVSYTHLDVYKRQTFCHPQKEEKVQYF